METVDDCQRIAAELRSAKIARELYPDRPVLAPAADCSALFEELYSDLPMSSHGFGKKGEFKAPVNAMLRVVKENKATKEVSCWKIRNVVQHP